MERQSFSRHLIILTLIVGLLSNVVAAGNHALYIQPKSCRARTKTRSSSASTPSTTPDNNNSTTNKPNSSAPTRHFSMTDQWMGQNFFKCVFLVLSFSPRSDADATTPEVGNSGIKRIQPTEMSTTSPKATPHPINSPTSKTTAQQSCE
jgi:cytoskeletal protein RodZ